MNIGIIFMNKIIFSPSVLMATFLLLFFSYATVGCNSHRRGDTKHSPARDTATAYVPSEEFNPIINVYIENSGSMDGYVKGQTEFEHIVYNYLVDLKQIRIAKEFNLKYINSEILPQQDDITDFIEKLSKTNYKSYYEVCDCFYWQQSV